MPVSECSAANFKVNGQEVSGIELKQSNLTKHEVYLTCSSTLKAGDNTITAEGIASIMGNVMAQQQINVTAPEIYVSGIEQSSENKAVMTVCGYAAAQPVTAVAGAAEYDADGQLTAVQFVKDLSITEAEEKITFNELPMQAGGYIKGFVWKNLNDLIPLTQSKKAEIK